MEPTTKRKRITAKCTAKVSGRKCGKPFSTFEDSDRALCPSCLFARKYPGMLPRAEVKAAARRKNALTEASIHAGAREHCIAECALAYTPKPEGEVTVDNFADNFWHINGLPGLLRGNEVGRGLIGMRGLCEPEISPECLELAA